MDRLIVKRGDGCAWRIAMDAAVARPNCTLVYFAWMGIYLIVVADGVASRRNWKLPTVSAA